VQQSQPLGKKEDRGSPVEKPVGGGVSKLTLAEAISGFGVDVETKLSTAARGSLDPVAVAADTKSRTGVLALFC
jgi:hypothetical protein